MTSTLKLALAVVLGVSAGGLGTYSAMLEVSSTATCLAPVSQTPTARHYGPALPPSPYLPLNGEDKRY